MGQYWGIWVRFTIPILFLPVRIESRCVTASIWFVPKDQSESQVKGTLEYFRTYGLKHLDSLEPIGTRPDDKFFAWDMKGCLGLVVSRPD